MSQLQNLLHDALIATNHVEQCAILSRQDRTVMATSAGFKVTGGRLSLLQCSHFFVSSFNIFVLSAAIEGFWRGFRCFLLIWGAFYIVNNRNGFIWSLNPESLNGYEIVAKYTIV